MSEIDTPGIHCIVILYDGKPMSDEMQETVMTSISNAITTRGIAIPEMISIVYKDSKGIADSIAKDVLMAKEGKVPSCEEDPIENALIYIAGRYKNELSRADKTMLIINLAGDIRDSKFTKGRNGIGDAALDNALEILCTKSVSIALMKKHGISKSDMEAIRRCYDMA